jgi:two-component system LytT family response regulator
MLKLIIIDDEQPILSMLEGIVEQYCEGVEVLATANSVENGVKQIARLKPDIVFLDINLTDGTGFDLLNQLKEPFPMVVFITAYDEYAVKAFKFSAIDYVMKPININEIQAAIKKCSVKLEKDNLSEKLKTFMQNMDGANGEEKKIVLKTAESIHIVRVGEIIRCESDHNYTEFYLTENRKLLVSKTLKEFDDLLNEYGFFRTHQSHLVNVNFINRFDKADGGELVLSNKHRIPVSKRKRDELFELFEQM